ncbi:hypothetical protein ElyMa_006072500 [Elysia marginata]|uniref:Transmembrane protein n=1 Tax=Elysia marginata TaxID=1093978 RepID=A0AAV4GNE7_9GAST|nr:hypothetical protein ElyMa_006072500 [Elysia marginata]
MIRIVVMVRRKRIMMIMTMMMVIMMIMMMMMMVLLLVVVVVVVKMMVNATVVTIRNKGIKDCIDDDGTVVNGSCVYKWDHGNENGKALEE